MKRVRLILWVFDFVFFFVEFEFVAFAFYIGVHEISYNLCIRSSVQFCSLCIIIQLVERTSYSKVEPSLVVYVITDRTSPPIPLAMSK